MTPPTAFVLLAHRPHKMMPANSSFRHWYVHIQDTHIIVIHAEFQCRNKNAPRIQPNTNNVPNTVALLQCCHSQNHHVCKRVRVYQHINSWGRWDEEARRAVRDINANYIKVMVQEYKLHIIIIIASSSLELSLSLAVSRKGVECRQKSLCDAYKVALIAGCDKGCEIK